MKAVQLGKWLKELTGTNSYNDALAKVEKALTPQQPRAPVGIVLMVDPDGSGLYWPTMTGQNLSLTQIRAVQTACRHFADLLERDVQMMLTREIEARLRKEMKGESDK
jgi:hypothetical protein